MANAELAKVAAHPERDPVVAARKFSQTLDIEPPVFKLHTGTHYLEQEKYISVNFPERLVKKWDHLQLIHLTDMQCGHTLYNKERGREFREWVLEAENRFILFGGDLVDAWRLGSPGSPYENTGEPQSQVRGFCAEWAPVSHRVLGYVGGNHERRACIGFGDLGTLISSVLRIPYSAGQQFIDITFGDWHGFRVDLFHGRGAARTPGAQLNMLHSFMVQSDANLCLVGHLHNAMSLFRWRRVSDRANLKPKYVKQGGAMSSSFLEYIGGYAEVAGMPMTDCMMACAEIEPDGKWQLQFR